MAAAGAYLFLPLWLELIFYIFFFSPSLLPNAKYAAEKNSEPKP